MLESASTLRQGAEIIALSITAIGLLVAVYQIYQARKESQASRDLEILLHLIESFRTRWEESWRASLREVKTIGYFNSSDRQQEDILNMLNWIDWLGQMIHSRDLSRADVVLRAVGPQINTILDVSRPKIVSDLEVHGEDYWWGVSVVEREHGKENSRR